MRGLSRNALVPFRFPIKMSARWEAAPRHFAVEEEFSKAWPGISALSA
jgi:hypothetical protein